MKYEVILEKGEYALILRGSRMEEYAVVNGLNKEIGEWGWTCCYYNFGNYTQIDKAQALFLALDYFRMRTENQLYHTLSIGRISNAIQRWID